MHSSCSYFFKMRSLIIELTNDLSSLLKSKLLTMPSGASITCLCLYYWPTIAPTAQDPEGPRQGGCFCPSYLLNSKVSAQRGLLQPLWMIVLFPALTYPKHSIRDLPSFTALTEFLFLISQGNHWVAMMTNLKSKPLPVVVVKY